MTGPFYRRRSLISLLAIVGLTSFSLERITAEPPTSEVAVEGVLVLRNGNVLAGHVLRLQDYYQVNLPKGQLQVRVDQVEMFCHSLAEAYERRRATRTGSTADAHLELARWCLRHDLLEYASRELLDARAIEPHHRKLQILERQLQYALRLAAKENHRPSSSNNIASGNIASENTEIEIESLERAPRWARVLFVRQIQPLLVRSCAVSGCHQQGSSAPFQLNRLAVDGVGHPDATLSNLAATLARVDWQSPDESPLLIRAGSVHGADREGPSRTLPTHQLHMLRTWVEQLAAANRKAGRVSSEVETATKNRRLPDKRTALAPKRHGPEVRLASAEAPDPFDPEVFNSRYLSPAKLESESKSAGETVDSSTARPQSAAPAATD